MASLILEPPESLKVLLQLHLLLCHPTPIKTSIKLINPMLTAGIASSSPSYVVDSIKTLGILLFVFLPLRQLWRKFFRESEKRERLRRLQDKSPPRAAVHKRKKMLSTAVAIQCHTTYFSLTPFRCIIRFLSTDSFFLSLPLWIAGSSTTN